MPGYLRSFYISDDLFEKLKDYAKRNRMTVNRALTEILTQFFATIPVKQEEVGDVKQTVKQDVKHNIPVKQTVNLTGSTNIPPPEVPEVTQQVKEESIVEEVATKTSEPVKPEFPVTEIPLAGVPSSKPVQEVSGDFSWAKKTDKFDDLVKRWEATFVNWDTEVLTETFRRCLDYPTRRAVVNILVDRFNGQLPETERSTIWNFFKDEDVRKWLDENKLTIKIVEENERKKIVLEVV